MMINLLNLPSFREAAIQAVRSRNQTTTGVAEINPLPIQIDYPRVDLTKELHMAFMRWQVAYRLMTIGFKSYATNIETTQKHCWETTLEYGANRKEVTFDL